MELLRSVIGGGGGPGDDPASTLSTAAETIERLVDRINHSTFLEDRRDACRALKAMSRKFRVEAGVQGLEAMTGVLESDRADEEIISYALDTLCNICSPDEFEEEVGQDSAREVPGGIGEQFTEIFLKQPENVQLVVDTLEEFDFRVRRPAVKLLTHLLLNKPREMQEIILGSRMGVSRLMDVLVETREVLRNDALLLLIQLTKGNVNLQKIVAFENCFDKLLDIVESEGNSDGGIVVEDCLRLMLNLLRNNSSNQTFFREGSYIQRMTPFFDLTLEVEEVEVGWSAQKVSNMLHMLSVVRTLVSPSNPNSVSQSCQKSIHQSSLLGKLCSILMAAGIPSDILTEAINAISECIRGSVANQEFFSRVQAPANPPRPALILLLMSMVNEKQPFSLRCAVLYCFQCYLHKNPDRQFEIISTLLPSHQDPNSVDITSGQLLCGGLFSPDHLSNWFSSTALAHGLMDQEHIKTELLRVQLSTSAGSEPVSLLIQVSNITQQTQSIQTRIGCLMMMSIWAHSCTPAVTSILSIPTVVPFLTGQIGSNEHDELERLGQGLCAFLLGLCILGNDDSVPNHTQEQLFHLIDRRIGLEIFIDKLSEISKHESYNRALKHPQPKSADAKELLFDHQFCQYFKRLEHSILTFLQKKKENKDGADAEVNDPAIVLQYKEFIREQDQRINDLTNANQYLQAELTKARSSLEEQNTTISTLRDQNDLLKAAATSIENAQPISLTNGASDAKNSEESSKSDAEWSAAKKVLEMEVKIRDDIIHELEMRLASSPADVAAPVSNGKPVSDSSEILQKQLDALQDAVSKKDMEMDNLKSEVELSFAKGREAARMESDALKSELASLRKEHDDLLLLLAEQ